MSLRALLWLGSLLGAGCGPGGTLQPTLSGSRARKLFPPPLGAGGDETGLSSMRG